MQAYVCVGVYMSGCTRNMVWCVWCMYAHPHQSHTHTLVSINDTHNFPTPTTHIAHIAHITHTTDIIHPTVMQSPSLRLRCFHPTIVNRCGSHKASPLCQPLMRLRLQVLLLLWLRLLQPLPWQQQIQQRCNSSCNSNRQTHCAPCV